MEQRVSASSSAAHSREDLEFAVNSLRENGRRVNNRGAQGSNAARFENIAWTTPNRSPNMANNRRVWLGLRDLFPHPYSIDDAHKFLRVAMTEQPTTKFCIEIEDRPPAASAFVSGKTSTDMSANSVIARRRILGTWQS